MFKYNGMIVILPTDDPKAVKAAAEKGNPDAYHQPEFLNVDFKVKDAKAKNVENKYYVSSYPNREAKRRSERNHMRKNSKGIPIGFSSLEFGRYQNRFNKVKTKEPSVDISDFSSAANSDRNLSNNE